MNMKSMGVIGAYNSEKSPHGGEKGGIPLRVVEALEGGLRGFNGLFHSSHYGPITKPIQLDDEQEDNTPLLRS